MKTAAAQGLAQWLAINEPELFAALAQRAQRAGELAGITDIFSSIGSGIAKAASSIGTGLSTAVKGVSSFLVSSDGLSTLATLGTAYMTNQAQKNALNVQIAQAQAGQQPAPIETRYDPVTGAYVPVLTTATGLQTLTPALSAQLLAQSQSFNWQRALPWLIGGGLGLAAFIWFLTRDRS